MKEFKGSCHCGRIRFRFRTEEIKGAVRCNCSMCLRKGALMSEESYVDFEWEGNEEDLGVYHWGDLTVNHYFCRHCGIYPFHNGIPHPDFEVKPGYRVNLGCVDIPNHLELPVTLIDGRSF